MSKKIKVALCLPWYDGADRDCTTQMLTMFNYFGKLSERLRHLAHGLPQTQDQWYLDQLPRLDPMETGAEIPLSMVGTEIEFAIADQMGCSLVGLARERCVDVALEWGADYCFFFDADMLIPTATFLTLLQDDVPVVAALAFTGREPITPVVYRAEEKFEPHATRKGEGLIHCDYQPVLDYKRDALQQVEAIGSGVMLIKADVFRKVPKPWFYTTGIGEDIHFCLMCKREGVPVYVDTRVKTPHKQTFPGWQTEKKYLERVRTDPGLGHLREWSQ